MTEDVVNRSAPAIEDVLALSPLQEGLFSLAEIAGDDLDLYTMQFIVDISGDVNTELLRRSVEVILERHPNLVLVRTVSKLGLAGLRLGLAAGPAEWMAQLEKVRPPYNVNVLTAAAAELLLDHHAVLDEQAARIVAAQQLDNGPVWLGLLLEDAEAVLALQPDHRALKALGMKVGVAGLHAAAEAPALMEVLVEDRGRGSDLQAALEVCVVTPPHEGRVLLEAVHGALDLATVVICPLGLRRCTFRRLVTVT